MHLDRPQPADRANNPGHDDGAAGAPAHLRRVVEIDPRENGRKAARTAVLFPLRCLENLRQQQGSSLAYFDSFWMVAVLTFADRVLGIIYETFCAEKRGHAGPE